MMAQQTQLPDFDTLWDYAHPDSTELAFRNILKNISLQENPDYYLQLQTQIARTLGLQQKYKEGFALLDEVFSNHTQEQFPVVTIRYHLEKGRILNTSGNPEEAHSHFIEAYHLSTKEKEDYYTIDAAHMLGIVEKEEQSLQWNLNAIEIAEKTDNLRAKKWLGSLLNNTGWTYFDMKAYDQAQLLFEKTLAYYKEIQHQQYASIANWSIAKCLRLKNEPQKALEIHFQNAENDTSGYTDEEIAECYYHMGDTLKAIPFFEKAYQKLSKDAWLQQHESERILRLKTLADI